MSRFVYAPALLLLQLLSLVLSSSCAHTAPSARVVTDPQPEVRQQPVDVSRSPWDQVPPEELYIVAERSENFRNERLEIWGQAARRNETVYFELTPAELREIVAAFDEVNFEQFESSPRGKLLHRRAAIEAGDYRKESFQTFESPEDPALKQLVDSIFAVAVPAAESGGRTIQSLKQGLESVAQGSFVPEVLSVSLHVRSNAPGGDGGFVIRVMGGEAELSRYEGSVLGSPRTVELSDSAIRDLASRLAYYDVEPMPANLFDEGYRELFVEVLGQEKKIQARSFANLTRERHGELQIRFEHLVSWLTAAKEEWFASAQN